MLFLKIFKFAEIVGQKTYSKQSSVSEFGNNLLLVARSYKLNTIELYWTLTPQQQLHQGVPTATCACQRPKRSWSVLARPFKSVGKSCNFGSAVRYFLHFLPGCGLSLWRFLWNNGCVWKIQWLIIIFHLSLGRSFSILQAHPKSY